MTPLSRVLNTGLITTIIFMCVSFRQEELPLLLHHRLRLLDIQCCLVAHMVLPYVISGEMTAELFSEKFEFKGDVKLNASK